MEISENAPFPSKALRLASEFKHRTKDFLYIPHVVKTSIHDATSGLIEISLHSLNRRAEAQIQTLGKEKFLIKDMLSVISEDMDVLDVGAAYGLHTLFASKKAKTVHAIEPDTETIRLLHKNVKLNHQQNVTIVPYAVLDHNAWVDLRTSGAGKKAPRLSTLVRNRPQDVHKFSRTEHVMARSLDSLIDAGTISIPHVMKVDIEGSEGFMIEGAEKLLSGAFEKRPQHMFMEIRPT